MAKRRTRRQIHTFTHPKITGDIPVFMCEDSDGAIHFEADLTAAKLTPRIPFCRSGDAIPALIADAQTFIDTYFTLTWEKFIYVAATPILNDAGVGIEITTGIIEHTTWPGASAGKDNVEMWRDAATPWETRGTAMNADFKHSNVQRFPWTAELEAASQRLVAKVSAFSQSILAGLTNENAAKNMLLGAAAKA